MEVLNCRVVGRSFTGAVYIGRPTKWGNPFIVDKDGSREEVVAKYKEHIESSPELMAALPELWGQNLICWCAPLACHGDVLIDLVHEHVRYGVIRR